MALARISASILPTTTRISSPCSFSTCASLRQQAAHLAPAPKIPYLITRTGTHNLPVYFDRKRGGNLHQTVIRRIEGDVQALKAELMSALQLDKDRIKINPITGHIIIKGNWKAKVEKFLLEKEF